MHEIDPQALAQAAGAAWMIVVGLLAVTFCVLSLLIPLFVWRIWHWTRATCREIERLNARVDRLFTLLASRGEIPEGDEFSFDAKESPSQQAQGEEPALPPS